MPRRGIIFGATLAVLLQCSFSAHAGQWLSEHESELGFAFSYPPELFQELPGDGKPSFHYFDNQFGRKVPRRWLEQSSAAISTAL